MSYKLPERKQIRMAEFSYSENRMYFVTICVKDKAKLLGRVVGYGSPNKANEIIPKFISLFKRYCNREIGHPIRQKRFYDHVVRNYSDYRDIRTYIDNNPARWSLDEYY